MANKGPNTVGSQFFITYGEQPHLDLKYTIIATVIDGFESNLIEKLPIDERNREFN